MLEEVRITGLGVIDDATLELSPGFTVVTGETGAGKTMVVTGLGLLARPGVGAAQSSREADGARLLKGALDLHFHMDPWTPGALNGQAGIAEVRVARARGMREIDQTGEHVVDHQ